MMRMASRLLGGRRAAMATVALIGVLATLLYVPTALAFPYQARFGTTTVYADRPIDAAMPGVLARADALLAASPIDRPRIARQVVLTDGGWRWRVMALGGSGAIGLRRPFGTALIFNRSDVARDLVINGAAVGGRRTLSRTIAHEMVHLLVARHIGEWRALMLPTWKREGYADFVAAEVEKWRPVVLASGAQVD